MDPAPIIYGILTVLIAIAILALRGALIESARAHRAQLEEMENDDDLHTP